MNKFCLPYHTRIQYKIRNKAKQCNAQKTEFLWASDLHEDGEELDVSTLKHKDLTFGIQYLRVTQVAADNG